MRNRIIMIVISILAIIGGYIFLDNKYKNRDIVKQSIIIGNKPYSINLGKIDVEDNMYNKKIISNYNEYKELSDYYEVEYMLNESSFDSYDYLAIIVENDYCNSTIEGIEDLTIKNNVDILVTINGDCSVCSLNKYLYLIRVNKGSINNQGINIKYQNKNNCER